MRRDLLHPLALLLKYFRKSWWAGYDSINVQDGASIDVCFVTRRLAEIASSFKIKRDFCKCNCDSCQIGINRLSLELGRVRNHPCRACDITSDGEIQYDRETAVK